MHDRDDHVHPGGQQHRGGQGQPDTNEKHRICQKLRLNAALAANSGYQATHQQESDYFAGHHHNILGPIGEGKSIVTPAKHKYIHIRTVLVYLATSKHRM